MLTAGAHDHGSQRACRVAAAVALTRPSRNAAAPSPRRLGEWDRRRVQAQLSHAAHEPTDASLELVAKQADLLDGPTRRVGEIPVDESCTWHVRPVGLRAELTTASARPIS